MLAAHRIPAHRTLERFGCMVVVTYMDVSQGKVGIQAIKGLADVAQLARILLNPTVRKTLKQGREAEPLEGSVVGQLRSTYSSASSARRSSSSRAASSCPWMSRPSARSSSSSKVVCESLMNKPFSCVLVPVYPMPAAVFMKRYNDSPFEPTG